MAGAGAAPLQPGADDPVAADGTPAAGDALTKIPEDHPVASGPKKARRPRLPEHLPIVREVIDPDAVLANPGAFRFVNEVITAQLDFLRGICFSRVAAWAGPGPGRAGLEGER
jgi:hypothetical protein